jgi:hypothetical protein
MMVGIDVWSQQTNARFTEQPWLETLMRWTGKFGDRLVTGAAEENRLPLRAPAPPLPILFSVNRKVFCSIELARFFPGVDRRVDNSERDNSQRVVVPNRTNSTKYIRVSQTQEQCIDAQRFEWRMLLRTN